jgi:excisionase family DNA binding protein
VTRAPADVLADLAALATRQAALTAELAACLRAPAPPRPADEAPEYLTTREAAALLGVSVRTLEALRAEGRGPSFVRCGRAVRYPRAAIASAVQSPSSAASATPSGDPHRQ